MNKRQSRTRATLSGNDRAKLMCGMGANSWTPEERERLRLLWMEHGAKLMQEPGKMKMGLHLFGAPGPSASLETGKPGNRHDLHSQN